MLDPCSSQTVFCTCEPRLTSPVLNRIGLGWWHSFVWLDGGPSKASLIPSQKGSPSTAPTCTEIRSQVITARLSRLAAQCELRDRITLGEVQASASICCSCCKAVTQSWFTCARLKHRQRSFYVKQKQERAATAFLCEALLPCVHIKKKLTH